MVDFNDDDEEDNHDDNDNDSWVAVHKDQSLS